MDLGQYNTLTIARYTSVGLYLKDSEGNDVLLPMKWVPEGVKEGEELEVFIYLDNEERPIATTLKPSATVGDFAPLQVRQVSAPGAFLDWGLEKDLFVPYKEQRDKMVAGKSYVVYVYIDELTDRIAASAKVENFTEKDTSGLQEGQEVELLVSGRSPLGYKVIINNRYLGLAYEEETFKTLAIGDRTTGYIKTVRDDGKVDVVLEKPGYGSIEPNAEKILRLLEMNEGYINLTDKSDPNEISVRLQMSKKTFKKAIGALYKQRVISLEPDGIRLTRQ